MDKIFYNKIMSERMSNSIRFADIYSSLDCKTLKRILSNFELLKYKYNMYNDGIINNFIFDINEAIHKCGLTPTQLDRIKLWTLGYTEKEIADMHNVSRYGVSKCIVASCNKILNFLKGMK